jgi:hypothetical protein
LGRNLYQETALLAHSIIRCVGDRWFAWISEVLIGTGETISALKKRAAISGLADVEKCARSSVVERANLMW